VSLWDLLMAWEGSGEGFYTGYNFGLVEALSVVLRGSRCRRTLPTVCATRSPPLMSNGSMARCVDVPCLVPVLAFFWLSGSSLFVGDARRHRGTGTVLTITE